MCGPADLKEPCSPLLPPSPDVVYSPGLSSVFEVEHNGRPMLLWILLKVGSINAVKMEVSTSEIEYKQKEFAYPRFM
jgi:hypothetical protein